MRTESDARRRPRLRRAKTHGKWSVKRQTGCRERRGRVATAWAFGVFFLLASPLAGVSPAQSGEERRLTPGGQIPPAVAQAPPAPEKKPQEEKGAAPKAAAPAPEAPSRTFKLSLADSIRIGLARNFDIRIEQMTPRIRAEDIQRQEAAFDVTGFARSNTGETLTPPTSTLARVDRTERSSQSAGAGLRQRFQTGTNYEVSTSLERRRDNSSTTSFDPAFEPILSLTLTQNLLKNLGTDVNTAEIRVARNNELISANTFQNRVIGVVSNIESLYWDLIFSIQDLEVKKKSLALAQDLLRRNKIQVEVGTLAPIEVVQAEASVASREADLILAERQVRDNEDRLKRALNLPDDFSSWDVRIQPTDEPQVIRQLPDIQESFRLAVQNRPDYAQAKLDIENKNIQVAFAQNQLLPTLDLKGSLALNGVQEEFGRAAEDVGSGDFYQWEVGLTFEFPLRNRAAKSALTQRKLEAAQSLLSLKNLEQQILLEVREAVRAIVTAQNRVNATRAARSLAEKKLDAEEKKLEVGLSTNFQVLQFQEDLATAQSNETRAVIDQIKALVDYRRVTSQTLRRYQIRLEDVGKKN